MACDRRSYAAWVDNTDEPNVGLVAVADFYFLLGDPVQTEVDYLVQLLFEHAKNRIVVFESPVWKTVLDKYFPKYSIIPFTHELGLKALENNFTADFCMFFESVDVFMRDGLGYAVVKSDTIITCASKLILDCLYH